MAGEEIRMDTGMCASCAHAETVTSARGSRFILCALSKIDRRFPKYPRLPVLECPGFHEVGPSGPFRTEVK